MLSFLSLRRDCVSSASGLNSFLFRSKKSRGTADHKQEIPIRQSVASLWRIQPAILAQIVKNRRDYAFLQMNSADRRLFRSKPVRNKGKPSLYRAQIIERTGHNNSIFKAAERVAFDGEGHRVRVQFCLAIADRPLSDAGRGRALSRSFSGDI